MKSGLLHVLVLVCLVVSTVLAPATKALAAPDWTCSSVTLNSGGGTNRNVQVTLSHSKADNERIDLNWGDGSPLLVIHELTNPTNSNYLSDTQTHNYGNAAGVYTITMRVWAAGEAPPDNDNENGNDWHECHTTVTFSGCSDNGPTACKVTDLDGGRNVTATVSYNLSAGQTAKIAWGDGITQTVGSSAGYVSNQIVTHHYTGSQTTFVVKLLIMTGDTVNITCTVATKMNASDVTLSSMRAEPAGAAIDWAAIGVALLGLVVLGNVAVLVAVRRR